MVRRDGKSSQYVEIDSLLLLLLPLLLSVSLLQPFLVASFLLCLGIGSRPPTEICFVNFLSAEASLPFRERQRGREAEGAAAEAA